MDWTLSALKTQPRSQGPLSYLRLFKSILVSGCSVPTKQETRWRLEVEIIEVRVIP